MKKALTIAGKDFRAYFYSPIAYIVAAFFLFIMGWMFFFNVKAFVFQGMGFRMGKTPSISEGIIRPVYGNMNVILLFLVPFITMRLFSEEKKLQTIQLLFTSPITVTDMVIGKFLSAFYFVLFMLFFTLAYPAFLYMYGTPEWGPIVCSYLGTVLLGMCYVSLGIFFSALTENQIVSGVLSLVSALFFWLINWASQSAGPVWSEVLDYLSLINHYNNFSQGMINSADVVYCLSFSGIFLFLTQRVLDSYRWR